MEDQVMTTPENAPPMPFLVNEGSIPDLIPKLAATASMAQEETSEAELEIPPKGFKSLTIHGPLIKILGKGPFPPYWQSLDLSLFKPGLTSDLLIGDTTSPRDLLPLCDFHRLRTLKLTGMVDSYQEIIFRACWLNPELWSLTLVMALEPELTTRALRKWKAIEGKDWKMEEYQKVDKTYHGDRGRGTIAAEYGYGEYLDTGAIARARLSAIPLERPYEEKVKHKLKIEHLELGGFVVDSKAINSCFDPEFLATIKFLDGCIDAGFSINTDHFKDVKIEVPLGQQQLPMQLPSIARIDQITKVAPPRTARPVGTNGLSANARGRLKTKQTKEKADLAAKQKQEREELEAKHKNEAAEKLTKASGNRAQGKWGFWQ